MNDTYILAPFSDEWILWNAVTSIFIFILVYFGGNLSKESNSTLVKVMLAVMIFEYVGIQAYYLDKGYWTVQSSLPFHLCRIMWFNAIVVLITRNQLAFELLLFIEIYFWGQHVGAFPLWFQYKTIRTTAGAFLAEAFFLLV